MSLLIFGSSKFLKSYLTPQDQFNIQQYLDRQYKAKCFTTPKANERIQKVTQISYKIPPSLLCVFKTISPMCLKNSLLSRSNNLT